jgi:hypothetical protein
MLIPIQSAYYVKHTPSLLNTILFIVLDIKNIFYMWCGVNY